MLQYRLYGGKSLPTGLQGFIKASANIGSVIGQCAFGACNYAFHIIHLALADTMRCDLGYAADAFGRKAVCARNSIYPSSSKALTLFKRRKRAHDHHLWHYYVYFRPHRFMPPQTLFWDSD